MICFCVVKLMFHPSIGAELIIVIFIQIFNANDNPNHQAGTWFKKKMPWSNNIANNVKGQTQTKEWEEAKHSKPGRQRENGKEMSNSYS